MRSAPNVSALALAPAVALALLLAGCGSSQPAPDAPAGGAASTAAAEAAGPDSAPGLAIGDVRVVLPAVPGRPGVAYFTLTQGGGAPRHIAAVDVTGFARTEMHESRVDGGVMSMVQVRTVRIEPGKTVAFKPGGMHVMLFDGDKALKAGDPGELTVTLDNGDKIGSSVRMSAPGGDDAMAGM